MWLNCLEAAGSGFSIFFLSNALLIESFSVEQAMYLAFILKKIIKNSCQNPNNAYKEEFDVQAGATIEQSVNTSCRAVEPRVNRVQRSKKDGKKSGFSFAFEKIILKSEFFLATGRQVSRALVSRS